MLIVKPEHAERSDDHHPVPEKHVDGLVVEVDGQHTLDGVRMYVDHVLTAHLEVTQSDAWERHVTLLRPVLILQHVAHDLKAERLVLAREDQVQQEQLADHVADVEDF